MNPIFSDAKNIMLRVLNRLEEWTLVLVLLALAFLSFAQVFCRYFLNFSFTWMEELSRYVGVFIAFLGASIGVKYGSHFSMDLVYERVSSDRWRHALKAMVNTVCGVLFLVVAWYGWEQAMKLRRFGANLFRIFQRLTDRIFPCFHGAQDRLPCQLVENERSEEKGEPREKDKRS